jgi:hypothetical protein
MQKNLHNSNQNSLSVLAIENIAHQMNVRLARQLKNVLIAVWKNAAAGNPLTKIEN